MDILEVGRREPGTDVQDVVADGQLLANVAAGAVMVEDEDDLPNLRNYGPGTIAYTAGYKAVWQLNNTRTTWVDMFGSNDIETWLEMDDDADPVVSDPEVSDG